MYERWGKTQGIFSSPRRVCRGLFVGMHGLHTVDKSQNRNNSSHRTVDNLVDGVDRYASIHLFAPGMNMQPLHTGPKPPPGRDPQQAAPFGSLFYTIL